MNKLNEYKIASFFSGVGGIELGFELTGGFKTLWANELDVFASRTYKENFNHKIVTCDIKNVESQDIPNVDIFVGGFPCQAFSVAGYKKGFEDERGVLFFDMLRIIKDKQPRVVFLENVKNLVGHDNGNTFAVIKESLEFYGYKVKHKVLNAKDYGNIPQNRERIYIVAFKNSSDFNNFDFPSSIPLTKSISDMLEEMVEDPSYYYDASKYDSFDEIAKSVTSQNKVYQWRRKYIRENKSNVFPTLTANMGTGGHNVPLILTERGIRKLTPRECFNVQGYPKSYTLPNDISKAQLYKQAGNSVVVPVVKRIAEELLYALKMTDSKIE